MPKAKLSQSATNSVRPERELEFADVAEGNGEAPKGLAVEESMILGRWR